MLESGLGAEFIWAIGPLASRRALGILDLVNRSDAEGDQAGGASWMTIWRNLVSIIKAD